MWTGTDMIVWGGFDDDFTNVGDGARWNQATNTWSPLVVTGAPSPRGAHTAVWTGTEIIWGGMDSILGLPWRRWPKVLALHDGELGFRRLLERISILIEVTGGTTTRSGSDPCMLGVAGNGGGDVVALYYYPPAHTPGAELPIVEWMHDDNTVEWVAQSFEIYLASRLREAEEWANPVVQAIRARLDLPARAAKKAKAPDWFLAAHGKKRKGSVEGDVAHERCLVRALRDVPDDAAATSELLVLYERLGWRWHAEQLRAAED